MTPDDAPRAGLPGALKLIVILIVLAIGTLASLMVLDVIPRSLFAETAGKLIALAGIAALVSLVIWLLAGRGDK